MKLFDSKAFIVLIVAVLMAGAGCAHKRSANAPWDISPNSAFTHDVVQRYVAATDQQKDRLRGVSMEIEIDAQLPRLKKSGTLHALRKISGLGRITYDLFRFSGDDTVKKDVIARYLRAETEAQETTESLDITPKNYKFRYKGVTSRNGQDVHVFEVKPFEKRVGLFKGQIWIDSATYLPVREEGEFVKNPSVFLKSVRFARDYNIQQGIAVPARIQSTVDTRLVGKAELTINFSNFSKLPGERAANIPSSTHEP